MTTTPQTRPNPATLAATAPVRINLTQDLVTGSKQSQGATLWPTWQGAAAAAARITEHTHRRPVIRLMRPTMAAAGDDHALRWWLDLSEVNFLNRLDIRTAAGRKSKLDAALGIRLDRYDRIIACDGSGNGSGGGHTLMPVTPVSDSESDTDTDTDQVLESAQPAPAHLIDKAGPMDPSDPVMSAWALVDSTGTARTGTVHGINPARRSSIAEGLALAYALVRAAETGPGTRTLILTDSMEFICGSDPVGVLQEMARTCPQAQIPIGQVRRALTNRLYRIEIAHLRSHLELDPALPARAWNNLADVLAASARGKVIAQDQSLRRALQAVGMNQLVLERPGIRTIHQLDTESNETTGSDEPDGAD